LESIELLLGVVFDCLHCCFSLLIVCLCIAGVALALSDLSSSLMTASAGDDNSTKELKGFVSYFMMCIEILLTVSLHNQADRW